MKTTNTGTTSHATGIGSNAGDAVTEPSAVAATVANRFARPAVAWLAAAMLAVTLAGCAAPQAAVSTVVQPFEQGIDGVTDALIAQLPRTLGFAGGSAPAALVVDPMIDAVSGLRTVDTRRLQERVIRRIRSQHPAIEVLEFQSAALSRATYLLTGTIARRDRPGVTTIDHATQIQLALVDIRSGAIVAQSAGRVTSLGLDATPLAFDGDSPVLAQDGVIDGYVRSTATPPGQRADKLYFDRLPVAPMVSEATASYEAGHYQQALTQFNVANAAPGGEQLRVLSGIYLASVKLEHEDEARQAFRRIVDYGITNRQLGVKFLFDPGTTSFWSDPKVSGAYPMWLGQIAQASIESKVCVDVVGHTSRTGSESVNDALSLERADAVRARLIGEQVELLRRTRTAGRGFRDNIIGTGTDNAADALDRRVVFKIVPCAG